MSRHVSFTRLCQSSDYSPELADFAAHFMFSTWYALPEEQVISAAQHPGFPTFQAFVRRTYKAAVLSNAVLFLGLHYFRRVHRAHQPEHTVPGSEASAFLSALVVASKMLMDNSYTNGTWSKVAKVPLSTVTALEREMLGLVAYKVHVEEAEFFDWLHEVKARMRAYQELHAVPARPTTALVGHKATELSGTLGGGGGLSSPSEFMHSPMEIFKRM
jgi:hypothetical protein